MSSRRAEQTATRLLDGRVLITGGTDGSDHVLSSTELFDPKTGRFIRGPAMSAARLDQTATLLADGRVLVAGGFGQLGQALRSLASAEIFDPTTNSWLNAAPMSVPRARQTATLLEGGRVLVVGGYSAGKPGKLGGFVTLAEIYDPLANRWSATNPMGTGGRQGHTATLLSDHRVLVAGGEGGLGSNPSAEVYDESTNSWSFIHFLLAPHVGHTATTLLDGRVLIVGGAGSISPTLNEPAGLATAELYDPPADRWKLLAPMHSTRDHHTATLLRDGRVLVVGGSFTSTPLPEVYDVRSDKWASVPGASVDRFSHTATLLDDGRVLVAGGYTSASTASSWLYDPTGSPAIGPGRFSPPGLPLLVAAGMAALLLLAWRKPSLIRLPRLAARPRGDEWIDP